MTREPEIGRQKIVTHNAPQGEQSVSLYLSFAEKTCSLDGSEYNRRDEAYCKAGVQLRGDDLIADVRHVRTPLVAELWHGGLRCRDAPGTGPGNQQLFR